MKNKIVCIVGESASGKSSLYDNLREKGYKVIDSYTTRPPRSENELGHTFISQDDFDSINDDLVAYTQFDGYDYGTTYKQIKESQFYIIDPDGVEDLSSKIGRNNLVVVYIYCSDHVRFQRMKETRGEEHAIQRLIHDKKKFNKFIENDDWDHLLHNEFPEQFDANVKRLERIYQQENSEG